MTTPGREFGIGKYGRMTFDKQRAPGWDGVPGQADNWIPITEPTTVWGASISTSAEIWIPVPGSIQSWTPS